MPDQPGWLSLDARGGLEVPLRCWWAPPQQGPARAGVLVLPEVFGVNGWVRSVAGRLADEGYAALAVPLFARTAPELELGYDEASLREGRSHKERTTTAELLADIARAADWLGSVVGERSALGCVGFCFGGHAALLAATLPQLAASVDFYGAGVATGRPGGGPPSLDLVPEIGGRLLCVCGSEDPLIPAPDREAIATALAAPLPDGSPSPHRFLSLAGGHGFMCEARADHRPESAAQGWTLLLDFLGDALAGEPAD